jgi:hypothetical protein
VSASCQLQFVPPLVKLREGIRKVKIVVVRVHPRGVPVLPQVGAACAGPGLLPHPRETGHENSQQNGDNGNYDQQFDESEPAFGVHRNTPYGKPRCCLFGRYHRTGFCSSKLIVDSAPVSGQGSTSPWRTHGRRHHKSIVALNLPVLCQRPRHEEPLTETEQRTCVIYM